MSIHLGSAGSSPTTATAVVIWLLVNRGVIRWRTVASTHAWCSIQIRTGFETQDQDMMTMICHT